MPQEIPVAEGDSVAARRQWRLVLERNPYIAALNLDHCVQIFMKHIIGVIFDVKHFWYQYAWQEHSTGHVHSFVWLKNAPNAEEIIIPEEQHQKMDEFKQFWDKIITVMNPFPKEDKNTPLLGQHPCNLEWTGLANTKQELSDLLNWVQHCTKCVLGYCQVKLKTPGQEEPQVCCCFDYPME
jgi:hypothetical protein